jgi:hypothetical protein
MRASVAYRVMSMFLPKVRGAIAEFFLIIFCSEDERRVENKKPNRNLRLGIPNGKYID